MSFIQFESGTDKEKARQELREAREEILKKAEQEAKQRDEYEAQRTLRGDDQWMLPSLSEKIEKSSASKSTAKKSKKSKKSSKKMKKEKKKKKKKKKKKSHSPPSPNSDGSSLEEEKIAKKKKKRFTESESISELCEQPQYEWVEKTASKTDSLPEKPLQREDWLLGMLVPTYSKPQKPDSKNSEKQEHIDSYDPTKSSRELNPYWKDGGTGLPTFQKPSCDDEKDDYQSNTSYCRSPHQHSSLNKSSWRKSKPSTSTRRSRSRSRSRTPERQEKVPKRRSSSSSSSSACDRSKSLECMEDQSLENAGSEAHAQVSGSSTYQNMNELGASMVKAQIMGCDERFDELQEQLTIAKELRENHKQEILSRIFERRCEPETKQSKKDRENVLLTTTNSKGVTRPLYQTNESDLWGGRAGKKAKKAKKAKKSKPAETHMHGDDKYDIREMFEKEKFGTAADQDKEFANIAGSDKDPNDDLEDIFAEKVRKEYEDDTIDGKERYRAILQHQKMARIMASCTKCIDSAKFDKQLLVAMGKTAYIALPWHEGLTESHCIISTFAHTSCVMQLDENVWSEIRGFMRAIERMFLSQKKDVLFFEIARNLHRKPHLEIHCVASKEFGLAPLYFKKAIDECENDWSTNKQLIELETADPKLLIPQDLPYFWITFGMGHGYGHVIEEERRFPETFGQEVIGGMLAMEPEKWRKPRKLTNPISKVKQFADWWKPFDITK